MQYDLPLQTSSVRVKSISTTEVSQVSDMQQAISRLEESRLAHAHARKERTYVKSVEIRFCRVPIWNILIIRTPRTNCTVVLCVTNP